MLLFIFRVRQHTKEMRVVRLATTVTRTPPPEVDESSQPTEHWSCTKRPATCVRNPYPYLRRIYDAKAVPSLPALGPWAPPAERPPSLESIHRVSLTVDLCEG